MKITTYKPTNFQKERRAMLGKRKVTSGLAVLAAGTALALGSPTLANAADGQSATTNAGASLCSDVMQNARDYMEKVGFKPDASSPTELYNALKEWSIGMPKTPWDRAQHYLREIAVSCPGVQQ